MQYPHKLVLNTTASSSQDNEGNWQPGSSSSVEVTCRAEPNAKGSVLKGADGVNVVYDWTVYMPLPVADIAAGTMVEIQDINGNKIGEGKVARFSRGTFNARVWI